MDTDYDVVRGDLGRTRDATGSVHLMPCEIDAEGRANVSDYFTPIIKKEVGADKSLYTPFEDQPKPDGDVGVLTATFRGRKLRGAPVKMPLGYSGVVLTQDAGGARGHTGKSWVPATKFSEFNYWNLETVPSEDDALAQALKWFELANAIHKRPAASDTVRRSPRKTPMTDYSNGGSPKKLRMD